ncbi:MAG: PepSY-associated TM helix domain-containing protein [Kangiellaceae bacterium]|nr:PepSY-associated TM helix domain-containing protein [Kangiellaceae bacterium]
MNSKNIKKKLFLASRWLHIYLSTVLFSLLLFFCLTGVVLNHVDWLDNTSEEGEMTVSMALSESQEQQSLQQVLPYIQKYLLDKYHLETIKTVEFDRESKEIIFDYSLPAGYALVIADIPANQLTIEYSKGNWVNVWADLHKGRHSGEVWSWVIDISAIFMSLFAISGMVILFQNRKKRTKGILAALFGTLSPVILYWFFVPYLSSA